MRAFISVRLDEKAAEEIKRIQKELKNSGLFDGKLTEEENLHLTLKFLGEIPDNLVEETKRRLKNINIKKFKVKLGEVGVFNKDFVRIVWVKLEGVDTLQKKVDESLKGLFAVEKRFMSHTTIARVKRVNDKKKSFEFLEKIKFRNIGFEVDKFYLMKSELFPEGPVYEVIEEYELL